MASVHVKHGHQKSGGKSFLLFVANGKRNTSRMERRVKKIERVRWLDKDCNKCGSQLNSWDARLSKSLAYKYPCCEACIAAEYDMSVETLRSRKEDYLGIRPRLGI